MPEAGPGPPGSTTRTRSVTCWGEEVTSTDAGEKLTCSTTGTPLSGLTHRLSGAAAAGPAPVSSATPEDSNAQDARATSPRRAGPGPVTARDMSPPSTAGTSTCRPARDDAATAQPAGVVAPVGAGEGTGGPVGLVEADGLGVAEGRATVTTPPVGSTTEPVRQPAPSMT